MFADQNDGGHEGEEAECYDNDDDYHYSWICICRDRQTVVQTEEYNDNTTDLALLI